MLVIASHYVYNSELQFRWKKSKFLLTMFVFNHLTILQIFYRNIKNFIILWFQDRTWPVTSMMQSWKISLHVH